MTATPRKRKTRETNVLNLCRDIVRPMVLNDEPINYVTMQKLHGYSHVKFEEATNIERALRNEPLIDAATLSKTAQEKVEILVRQRIRQAEVEIMNRENLRYRQLMDKVLEEHRRKEAHYNLVIAQRKGLVKKELFNRIRFALHPDTFLNTTVEDRNELCQEWEKLKTIIMTEADAPTRFGDLPKTAAEWEQRKMEVQAQRAAERKARAKNKTANVAR